MLPPSRKRRVISLDQKKEIIEASVGKNSKDMSTEFGIPASSVRNILSDKAAILKATEKSGYRKRVHLKSAKHEDLEKAIF
uniref:HTH psq-type domain-containing protein n=1 Tax=Ditylenchus dipsaci TaxID=166011 RepID=A0A915EDH6_9BILA